MQEDDHGPAEDGTRDEGAESELLDKELSRDLAKDITCIQLESFTNARQDLLG